MEDFTAARVTELLFRTEIPNLERVVADYLAHKSEVWMLIDNIDKGWPTQGACAEDVLIIRSLLDASRKIQQRLRFRYIVRFKVSPDLTGGVTGRGCASVGWEPSLDGNS